MTKIKIAASLMVLIMAILQAFYAIYAFVDPSSFSQLRGTELFMVEDSDWVVIYASRTMFVALIIGFLLLQKEFKLLMWASIFGTVMPIIDAWLAYQAGAENAVIYKHIATIVYLLVTCSLLKIVQENENNA